MSNKHNRNLVIFSVIFLIMIVLVTWMYMVIEKKYRMRHQAMTEAEIKAEMISRIVPGDKNADPEKKQDMVEMIWKGNAVPAKPSKTD